MQDETIDTIVVGAGQAGLAMSRHLTGLGRPHLVLERNRIAERWRTGRWDSLVANGPAWHDRFPDATFGDTEPDGFAPKNEVVAYFEAYARTHKAPVRCGVEVTRARKINDDPAAFELETSAGTIRTRSLVVATGPFQTPVIPTLMPRRAGLTQIHSAEYRNPAQLPDGAIVVVGAGSSGAQIADELRRAGRRVYLSIGPHDRPPRRYRGKDFVWWLGVLGKWAAESPGPGTEHVTIAVSGAEGGRTVDFRDFAARGITLVGRTEGFADGKLTFAPGLEATIAAGDANFLSVLREADAYVAREGLDLPEEPEARAIGPMPDCVTAPLASLDLAEAGVSTILWATGYALDFGWLEVDAFDAAGRPRHKKGVSDVAGLYFLGLPWLTCRGSSFIWGVWRDAEALARHIAARDGLAAAE